MTPKVSGILVDGRRSQAIWTARSGVSVISRCDHSSLASSLTTGASQKVTKRPPSEAAAVVDVPVADVALHARPEQQQRRRLGAGRDDDAAARRNESHRWSLAASVWTRRRRGRRRDDRDTRRAPCVMTVVVAGPRDAHGLRLGEDAHAVRRQQVRSGPSRRAGPRRLCVDAAGMRRPRRTARRRRRGRPSAGATTPPRRPLRPHFDLKVRQKTSVPGPSGRSSRSPRSAGPRGRCPR